MSMDRRYYGYYVLAPDHTPRPADLWEWAAMLENGDARRVAVDSIADADVSTVFLGLDHNYHRSGPPILFETMVFDVSDEPGVTIEEYQTRCSTWDEAVEMHAEAVRWAGWHELWWRRGRDRGWWE